MTPPIWYLDVDGVLNAITTYGPKGFEYGSASPGPTYGAFPIWWHPEIIARIAELHTTGVVEVQWLTTWGSGANLELRELLGLPEFTVAAEPRDYLIPSQTWWKLTAVQKLHDATRKYIWTDDDLAYEPEARSWATTNGYAWYSPAQHRGIDFEMLKEIEELVK